MYKIYVIDFFPNSREDNQITSSRFRLLTECEGEGAAFAIAKSEFVIRKNKTVIIDPNGVPIGGY
jgi:hypothetical protein